MASFNRKLPALSVLQKKIFQKESLQELIHIWKFQDKKTVFTNGCFDILHRGHIDYLAKASDLGDIFIVGVNSDASVKKLGKGNSRPLQDEQTRAIILASLHFVNAVVIFEEETPYELISFLQPDVLVKGADYDANETDPKSKKYIVGSDIVRSEGGEVKTLEFLEGYSTSAIEKKILNK